ncbi:hypothetical protein [Methanobacterium ferruginis]|uniref:hypothetical protein n=1 Tax=Methanobacterium ferruginis TaxID=710191 RepID=UPI002573D5D6|nr:hypothetical protein [Methanobacterium ferruginis]BDZ68905.1 hypothetical protein GCM10025860_23530 [Methanobacterium ferruginis]
MKDNSSIENVSTPKGQPKDPLLSSTLNKNKNSEANLSSSDETRRVKDLEKELRAKEAEIDFLKEKLTNNQEIMLDVIEEKKELKKQIHDFEVKEVDLRLNNFRDLQRKHHKLEHRLFVTKNQLDEARQELEFRAKLIKDLEKRGVSDYILGRFPESLIEYNKRG